MASSSSSSSSGGGGVGGVGSRSSSSWFPSDVDAVRAAREEVKNMFRSSDQLTRLQPYLGECLRRKAAVEAQLSSAVRTQVDETRLGLQLLREASQMMTRMRDNFAAIDQYCKDCKMVLRDSPEINRVNLARKNLDATTRLLEKFRSLPLQAETIIDDLDENDRHIKQVYKSLRKLFHLRDSAMDGTPGGGASGFSDDFLAQLQANFAELSKSAEIIEERIWENMADAAFLAKDDPITLVRTLEVIELEDRAMRKVFGAKAKEDPHVLALTAATTSTGEKADKAPTLSKKVSTTSSQFLGSPEVRTMREKCLNTLEKSIADQFQHLHIDEEQHKEQERKEAAEKRRKLAEKEARQKEAAKRAAKPTQADEDVDEPDDAHSPGPPIARVGSGGLYHDDEDDVPEVGSDSDRNAPSEYILTILEEMSELVDQLPTTLGHMIPCFPPDYHLAAFYVERYLRWLKLTLSFHTNDPGKLSKRALLKTVNWIEWYRGELRKWATKFPGCVALTQQTTMVASSLVDVAPERRAREAKKEQQELAYFDDLIRELMKYYTASTEETLIKLCDNILASEMTAEAERNASGHYVTSGPPDLFYTINSTIEIVLANFGLNAKPLSFVCIMLARVFEHYQNSQLAFLSDVTRGEKEEDDQLFFGPRQLHKTDTYFAAVINNATICQEHMDDLKDKILDRLREAEGIETQPQQVVVAPGQEKPISLLEQMEATFEECGEGFISVASEGLDLLVLQISITLQKPMTNLFSPSWLKDSGVTDDIVLTLQDFMQDYQRWIGRDAYFTRMLVKCLHSVIAEYLRILTLTKPQVSTQLFERLKADKGILQQFFAQYTVPEDAPLLPVAVLKNELRLLTLVNKVVHEDVDFMSVHFDKLIARFGHSAGEVMEGLIAMRTDLSRAQRAEVLQKFAEKLPRANPSDLLEKHLVAQTAAAMASPKTKGDGAKGGKQRGGMRDASGEEETSIKGFWERFRSRDKTKATAAAAGGKQLAKSKSTAAAPQHHGHQMSLQEFTS